MGFSDKLFSGQHGLAIFIEGEKNLLFDTGPSDVLLHNARLAGLDLKSTDWVVLSHGHWDHADGLGPLARAGVGARLLAHPAVFRDRRSPKGLYNGAAMSREEAAGSFDLVESAGPFEIAEGIFFLGEVPRNNDFEAKQTPFHYVEGGKEHPDFLPDDTALALATEQGVAVVTGCSHAGICNICEYAKKVTGQDRIAMVIGGFHLLGDSPAIPRTVEYFRAQKVPLLYPMHCTGLPARAAFYEAFRARGLYTGDTLDIS